MVSFYLFVLMVGFAYIGRFVIEYECKITEKLWNIRRIAAD